MNSERPPKSKNPEQAPRSRRTNILILETFIGGFLELAKTEGLSLLEVEFGKVKKRVRSDGSTQETTVPVTVTPTKKIDNKHWTRRKYLLTGNKATYYVEFDNISTEGGVDHFLGITKTSPYNKAKNKAEWADELEKGKIKHSVYGQNESLLSSVSVTFDGGIVAFAKIAGEYDDLLENFYQNLTRYSSTKYPQL